jgi:uncharacterized alpha-E superfamily protein
MMLARVADSFYWMNRYLERVEHIARLIGLQLERLPSSPARDVAAGWRRLFRSLGERPPGADTYGGAQDEDDFLFADGYTLTDYLTFEAANPGSIMFCLTAARENARQVRDAISNAIWSSLNREYLRLQDIALVDIWRRDPAALYRGIIRAVQLFDGICASSMRRDTGWHFMRLGRFIERVQLVGSLLEAHCAAAPDPAEERGDWIGLLWACDAFEAYCQLHGAQIREKKVLDFLVYDAGLPHALCFAVNGIWSSLEAIDPPVAGRVSAAPHEMAGRLVSILSRQEMNLGVGEDGRDALADLVALCRECHETLERAYMSRPTLEQLANAQRRD